MRYFVLSQIAFHSMDTVANGFPVCISSVLGAVCGRSGGLKRSRIGYGAGPFLIVQPTATRDDAAFMVSSARAIGRRSALSTSTEERALRVPKPFARILISRPDSLRI